MTIRATLRGAHEGLVAPLVVDPDGGDRSRDGQVGAANAIRDTALEQSGGGRAMLVVSDAGQGSSRHPVLLSSLGKGTAAGPRRLEVVIGGWRFELEVEPEARAALREKARRDRGASGQSGPSEVRAIIPGVVVSVAVAVGDTVEAGQQLLVVEAMKMQNELRAPRAGKIARLTVGDRSTIEVGDLLVVVE